MVIKEHGMGWIIEPVTSDQRQALEMIIEGLRLMDPITSTGADVPPTNRSLSSGHDHYKVDIKL